MNKIKIFKLEFLEALCSAEIIDQGKWRHGRSVRYLIQHDGKHFAVWVQEHPEEGLQLFDTYVELTEVKPVEKTITLWEPVE